jgi:hypothetical protein
MERRVQNYLPIMIMDQTNSPKNLPEDTQQLRVRSRCSPTELLKVTALQSKRPSTSKPQPIKILAAAGQAELYTFFLIKNLHRLVSGLRRGMK